MPLAYPRVGAQTATREQITRLRLGKEGTGWRQGADQAGLKKMLGKTQAASLCKAQAAALMYPGRQVRSPEMSTEMPT